MQLTTLKPISLLVLSVLAVDSYADSLLYVPTGESNELVIIDLKTDKVVSRIGELENAHGLSSSANSEYLIAGSMHVPIAKQNKGVVKPSAVSDAEHEAHHGGDAAKSMTRKGGLSYVSIIHPKRGHVMRRITVPGLTHHTAVSPNGEIAIAVHSGMGGISVIDLEQMAVIKTVKTGLWPNYAVFTNQGKRLFVSNARPGTVSEIDTLNWTVTREFKVGKEPEHMVLDSKSKMLYVANKGEGSVSVIDITQGVVTKTYATGKGVHGLDVSDDGHWLFASNRSSNTLTRVDLKTGSHKDMILSPAPYHLTYVSGMNKVYVSSRKLPKIWVIDAETLETTNEIHLGKGFAHQMVIKTN